MSKRETHILKMTLSQAGLTAKLIFDNLTILICEHESNDKKHFVSKPYDPLFYDLVAIPFRNSISNSNREELQYLRFETTLNSLGELRVLS